MQYTARLLNAIYHSASKCNIPPTSVRCENWKVFVRWCSIFVFTSRTYYQTCSALISHIFDPHTIRSTLRHSKWYKQTFFLPFGRQRIFWKLCPSFQPSVCICCHSNQVDAEEMETFVKGHLPRGQWGYIEGQWISTVHLGQGRLLSVTLQPTGKKAWTDGYPSCLQMETCNIKTFLSLFSIKISHWLLFYR